MAQIDKLIYFPLLFWFSILFFSLYFVIFIYVLPLIFSGLRVRSLFLTAAFGEIFWVGFFFFFITISYRNSSFVPFVSFIFSILKGMIHLGFAIRLLLSNLF